MIIWFMNSVLLLVEVDINVSVPIACEDVAINPVRFPDSTTQTGLAESASRVPAVVRFIVLFASDRVLDSGASRKSTNPPPS
jgi:hypothetical protein